MTKARSLRAFFKKFFNLDSSGMSVSAVLDEITQNNETFPGGGGSGGLYAPVEWVSTQEEKYRIPFSYNQIKTVIEAGGMVQFSSTYEVEGVLTTAFSHVSQFMTGEQGGVTMYAVYCHNVSGDGDFTFIGTDPDVPLVSQNLLLSTQDDTA